MSIEKPASGRGEDVESVFASLACLLDRRGAPAAEPPRGSEEPLAPELGEEDAPDEPTLIRPRLKPSSCPTFPLRVPPTDCPVRAPTASSGKRVTATSPEASQSIAPPAVTWARAAFTVAFALTTSRPSSDAATCTRASFPS